MTCSACPQQWDAYLDNKQVGYLRLRHGCFTVSYPDVGGEEVYCSYPRGDGSFEEDERDQELDRAKEAIWNRLQKEST